ncbi:MAG: TetR/AcrR family transcriptional regulator [Bacteroides sp.]|nr:TetR/AcrR family transcriptional regulator [Bacteroides sp.]
MSPRTQEQFEEMRETRREQIMKAALELFAREGYANCSISRLANHTGISKGLMYNYFESKEALLGNIIEEGMSDIMAFFNPDNDGILTTEELAGFVRKVLWSIRENQNFWILYINIIFQPRVKELLAGKPFSSVMDQYGPMMMNYFENQGFENPALEMLTFSALIEGFGMLVVYGESGYELPDELVQSYEERVIGMLTRKQA